MRKIKLKKLKWYPTNLGVIWILLFIFYFFNLSFCFVFITPERWQIGRPFILTVCSHALGHTFQLEPTKTLFLLFFLKYNQNLQSGKLVMFTNHNSNVQKKWTFQTWSGMWMGIIMLCWSVKSGPIRGLHTFFRFEFW